MTTTEQGNPAAAGRVRRTKGRKAVEKKAQKLERLTVEYVATDSLRPNAYNPNRQSEDDFELLVRSMEEDGFTQPIVALTDNTIVDGEHRWRAARALEIAEVPVVHVDMTPEQMRIATLRHNRARGSEDFELSAAVLRDLQELGAIDWAMDSLMLSDAELQKMLDDIPAPDALADEEFSEAWAPGEPEGGRDRDLPGAHVQTSTTAEAADALREREKAEALARTEEERAMARREHDLFRLQLVYSGEQAKIVRAALGDRPADRLLEMCKLAVVAEGAATE